MDGVWKNVNIPNAILSTQISQHMQYDNVYQKNYNEGHWSVTRPSIVNSNEIFHYILPPDWRILTHIEGEYLGDFA